ncbi:MAG TPA: two-component regulator propeller domain-containing protein, partial [Segetibacter sp.]
MRLLLLLSFTFSISISLAQSRIEFSRLGVNEGLSQNSVYAIHQDQQGFLWIGTGDGLNRYDGKGFKVYREKYGDTSSKNLPGRLITSDIIEDKQQQLWFNTNNGITILNKKEERFKQPSKLNSAIAEWQHGAQPLGVDSRNDVWFLSGSKLVVLVQKNWNFKKVSDVANVIEAVLLKDNVYFVTAEGLFVLSTATQSYKKLASLSNAGRLRLIAKDKLAIVSGATALIFNMESGAEKVFAIKDKNGKPSALADVLYEYPENSFYLRIPGEGLIRYNSESDKATFLEHEEGNSSSLSNNYITTSFVDRSNNLWIGTEGGGLSRMDLKPQKFKSFPAYNVNVKQAANLMVKSIYTVGDKILIGTFSQGMYVLGSTGVNYRRVLFSNKLENPTEPAINFIQRDASGNLWINTGSSIGYIDQVTFKFKEINFPKPVKKSASNNKWLYSLLEYQPGKFLVGSFDGLHRMDMVKGKIHSYNLPGDSVMNGYIQSLQMASDGSIYVGKIRNGFWRIRLTDDGIKVIDKGLLTSGVRHFYFDKKKPVVWMASESGLVAYNSEKNHYTIFDENSGLSNSYVYGILSENDTTLWLSTNKGINRAVIRHNDDGSTTARFNFFTQIDGLQSNEFNTGAFHKSIDGTLFFGGVNGINWFKPSQVVNNNYKAPLAFTYLAVNEKEYSSSTAVNYLSSVTLPYDQNSLYIRFASLEFTNAGANLYAYQLEGFDKEWIQSQTI